MKIIPIKEIQIPEHKIIVELKNKKDFDEWVGDAYAFKYQGKSRNIYYAYDELVLAKYIEDKK